MELKRVRLDSSGDFRQRSQAAQRASFLVSRRIAQAQKAHTIGEELILPSCKDIAQCLLGDDALQKFNTVPLSNSTVQRRIVEMADDIKQQVVEELRSTPLGLFSIQLDESTDVAGCAQLLVFVRYVHELELKDEFLFCHALESTTTGEDVFREVSGFLEQVGLSWGNVSGCTTDGAPAMLGVKSGFQARVRNENPNAIGNHCMIHRYALAAKTLPPSLKQVLDNVVAMVNHIKSSALNTRMFRLICQDLNAQQQHLLYHTEVRWLSRGNVVGRFVELKDEILEFFKQSKKQICREYEDHLRDSEWLLQLAYLTDIFTRLNVLNKSLQGRNSSVHDFMDKLNAFIAKTQLWEANMAKGRLEMFEQLSEMTQSFSSKVDISEQVIAHLRSLRTEVQRYFPNIAHADLKILRNPFHVNVEDVPAALQEDFLDLKSDSTLRDAFEALPLDKFWIQVSGTYRMLAQEPLKQLLLFPSTYLCEQGFSTLLNIKSKQRGRLNVEPDLRVALSKTVPRVDRLVSLK